MRKNNVLHSLPVEMEKVLSLISSFIFCVLIAGLVLSGSVACVPEKEVKDDGMEYVWPLPPEKPRIKYLKSIWGEDDIRGTSALEVIVGKDPSSDMVKPYGVTTDTMGRIYVTDTVSRTVFVFDEQQSEMYFLGDRKHLFKIPAGVATDNMNHVFVSDTGHDAIFIFDENGSFVKQFGKGILNNPAGMAVDNTRGRLYVASVKTNRIEVFDLQGEHLFGFGQLGGGPGQFNFPRDVAIDFFGDVYVVDSANFRIQVFNSEGGYIREFGRLGSSPGQFSRPKAIAVDAQANVYVTDAAFNNFQVFDSLGTLLLFVGVSGTFAPGEFSLPADIHVDNRNRIYVVDQLNRRVQVFQKLD